MKSLNPFTNQHCLTNQQPFIHRKTPLSIIMTTAISHRPLHTLLYPLATMLNLQPITTTTTLLLMPLFNLQSITTIATLLPVPLFINNTLLLMHLFNIQLVTTIVTTLLLTRLFPNLLQFILHSMFLYLLNPE